MTPLERRNYALTCARLRMLPGKDRTLLTTEAIDAVCEELLRLKADIEEVLQYVDDAKREAEKLGRVSGEPLNLFLRRLRESQ